MRTATEEEADQYVAATRALVEAGKVIARLLKETDIEGGRQQYRCRSLLDGYTALIGVELTEEPSAPGSEGKQGQGPVVIFAGDDEPPTPEWPATVWPGSEPPKE